jgi:hypothetical protein
MCSRLPIQYAQAATTNGVIKNLEAQAEDDYVAPKSESPDNAPPASVDIATVPTSEQPVVEVETQAEAEENDEEEEDEEDMDAEESDDVRRIGLYCHCVPSSVPIPTCFHPHIGH